MPLPWIRLDTQWPQNPKFLVLAEDRRWRAIVTYMAGLAWCGAQGQAGFIPYYALPMIHGTRRDAAALVDARLWLAVDGGWQINDWDSHQLSGEENAARTRRARSAALIRWHGTPDGPKSRLKRVD